jgi:hypothetical protein
MSENAAAHARRAMGEQLRRYLELRDEHGPDRAREMALAGMPQRQAARLGPALAAPTLADGLGPAVPALAAIGLRVEFLDISTPEEDAAVEIMLDCSCRAAAAELGRETIEPVLCELELEAARRAFPDFGIRTLARQADGRHVCAFRFSRRSGSAPGQAADRLMEET